MPDTLLHTTRALEVLAAHVAGATPRVRLFGCEASFASCAIGNVAAAVPAKQRPLVVVVPEEPQAIALARDLAFWVAGPGRSEDPTAPPPVLHLPAVETSPYA